MSELEPDVSGTVPQGVVSTPPATAEEAAVILAAYEALWPKSSVVSEVAPVNSDWRFAGRWWRAIGPRAQIPVRR